MTAVAVLLCGAAAVAWLGGDALRERVDGLAGDLAQTGSPAGPPGPLGPPTVPTPGVGAAPEPLATPPAVEPGDPSHRFLQLQADGVTPVAWDPCRPVPFVMRPEGAPPGADALVRDALAEVSAATGLVLQLEGATDEAPGTDRQPYQPDRYGDRWAPVLIAWATADEQPDFGAELVAGQAGPGAASVGPDGPQVYVTGTVELSQQFYADVAAVEGGADQGRAVLLHELGHLVGLDHVNDPSQLMYAQESPEVTGFAAGDLTGLAALGRGVCEPRL